MSATTKKILGLATFNGDNVAIIEAYAPAYRNYKLSYLIAYDCHLQWVTDSDLINIVWLAA